MTCRAMVVKTASYIFIETGEGKFKFQIGMRDRTLNDERVQIRLIIKGGSEALFSIKIIKTSCDTDGIYFTVILF